MIRLFPQSRREYLRKSQVQSNPRVDFDEAKLTRTDFREADFGVKDSVFGVEFRDCYFEETLMPDGSVRNNS
jgi:Pentapeptide repeats (8 copies)